MGQTVVGFMFGVIPSTDPFDDFNGDIQLFCDDMEGESPDWCDDHSVLGYVVELDVDSEVLPLSIEQLCQLPTFVRAKHMWEIFATYAKDCEIEFDRPTLHIVRREIS